MALSFTQWNSKGYCTPPVGSFSASFNPSRVRYASTLGASQSGNCFAASRAALLPRSTSCCGENMFQPGLSFVRCALAAGTNGRQKTPSRATPRAKARKVCSVCPHLSSRCSLVLCPWTCIRVSPEFPLLIANCSFPNQCAQSHRPSGETGVPSLQDYFTPRLREKKKPGWHCTGAESEREVKSVGISSGPRKSTRHARGWLRRDRRRRSVNRLAAARLCSASRGDGFGTASG